MFYDDYETEVLSPKLEQWAPLILDRVTKHFPNAYYISVSGSILTTRFNPGSDIDVLALIEGDEPEYNSIQLRCENCDNRVLEIAVMPYFRLIQHFDLAPHINNIILITEAYYSISLLDNNNLRIMIRDQAHRILKKGPVKCSTKILDVYRRRLTDVINNTKFTHDEIEHKIGIYTLSNLLSEIILRINNEWLARQDHWIYRRLKDCKSPLAKNLVDAISHDNKDLLFQIAEQVLAEIGGPPQDGFTIKIM